MDTTNKIRLNELSSYIDMCRRNGLSTASELDKLSERAAKVYAIAGGSDAYYFPAEDVFVILSFTFTSKHYLGPNALAKWSDHELTYFAKKDRRNSCKKPILAYIQGGEMIGYPLKKLEKGLFTIGGPFSCYGGWGGWSA